MALSSPQVEHYPASLLLLAADTHASMARGRGDTVPAAGARQPGTRQRPLPPPQAHEANRRDTILLETVVLEAQIDPSPNSCIFVSLK